MRLRLTVLLAVLLLPRPVPAADYSALLPDDYDRLYAVSGRDRNGTTSIVTIKLTYNKHEKLKDMAAQKAKEKERYAYGDYKLVGEPTKRQNCAGLVTERIGPADLARPFIAQADDLFKILRTFGERVAVLQNGDVAVWTKDGKTAGHVGVVVGRSPLLKPVILTKDNEEGTYEFTLGRMPIGWESWNPFSVAFADDLDPLVKAYGPAQFWRCDIKALHWEEITFFGPWAEEGGGPALEGVPVKGEPGAFVLKRVTPDAWNAACEIVGRFTAVPPDPGDDWTVGRARGKMACRSALSSREKCGEMAQWVDAEARLELVTDGTGKAKVVLRTSTACPSFTPCRWEIGASRPREGAFVHLAPGAAAAPPCPADQKQGGKPLLFLREKVYHTLDAATRELVPGRGGKGPNSWWTMDERAFHQENNKGLIVDASWDPMPEALAPMEKYTFTLRAKASGPGWVDFAVYPEMDTGSWSITLKEGSESVRPSFLNGWRMRLGKEEGQPDRPEGWMTLEIRVVGTTGKINFNNNVVEDATGDLSHIKDLFLTLNCMNRGTITWGWSKAQ